MELSMGERVAKATEYLAKGVSGFERATQADEEFQVRAQTSKACENVFHALVALSDALLSDHGYPPVETHGDRAERLEDIGRMDLARLYYEAMAVLHTEGYYHQRAGRSQERLIREVEEVVTREAEKLA